MHLEKFQVHKIKNGRLSAIIHLDRPDIVEYCSFYTITPISWRYSDLISRSFYNNFLFYIIYTDIFILIKLCCSAGATTCHQTRYI